MDIFEILGPIMVGPSSSHTAGAVRIGNMARTLLGQEPAWAQIDLYGSFADTGRGHGTDRALVAGLLGMTPDDLRVPESFQLAKESGLEVRFGLAQLRQAHPNTAVLHLRGKQGASLAMQACSVGGGRIQVTQLDGIDVSFTGDFNTLVVHNRDAYGLVAEVSRMLSMAHINIANMSTCRHERGGDALMVIETDQQVPPAVLAWIRELPKVIGVTYYQRPTEENNV